MFGDPKEDTQLAHTWRILQQVHALYYPSSGGPSDAAANAAAASTATDGGAAGHHQHHRPKNVAGCLATVRRRVLEGCSVVFSGLLPRGLDPRRTDLGYMATALGAAVTEAMTPGTTHVVAENPSTEKVYHARQRGETVAVVTRAWLQLSFWHCERKPEAQFPLVGKAKGAGLDGSGGPVAPVEKPQVIAAAVAAAYPEGEDGEGVAAGEGDAARASKRAKTEGSSDDAKPSAKVVAGAIVAVAMEEGEGEGGGDGDWEQALADELG